MNPLGLTSLAGWEDRYFISKDGRVFSSPNSHHKELLELKPQRGRKGRKDGFLRLNLQAGNNNDWYLIHRLVAVTFIPQPENCNDVRHKDGDRTNNSVENLEWYYNPNIIDRKILQKAYGWSKYGGVNFGLVQEDKEQEWACQACSITQASELPAYMFEFLDNEFIRICSVCQARKVQDHISTLDDLLSLTRSSHEWWA